MLMKARFSAPVFYYHLDSCINNRWVPKETLNELIKVCQCIQDFRSKICIITKNQPLWILLNSYLKADKSTEGKRDDMLKFASFLAGTWNYLFEIV